MAQSAHHVTTAGPSRRVLCDLPSYDLHTLSRSRLAHKWRSSSGWDDKCHTAQHITVRTAVATIKLRCKLLPGSGAHTTRPVPHPRPPHKTRGLRPRSAAGRPSTVPGDVPGG